ncbi:hypothetical protein [Micromonospora profundi]|uniref:hypothetical protein n=1 Tax=Micromonospora profundi TaxID=1420889 RepID=UPI000A8C9617
MAALNPGRRRRGGIVADVVFHSDRSSEGECTLADFARACARCKVRQSMGRDGSCFDAAEATFSTFTV